MEIKTENIKILRTKTGAGMVDCKKALEEAQGDIAKAVEILRKKGITKAAKRGGREISEGIIKVDVNEAGNEGYIMEINSETDFVARNEKFQKLAEDVLEIIKTKDVKNLDELLSQIMADSTVKDALDSLSGTIGEKLGIKGIAKLSGKTVAAYSHLDGKIGVLVALNTEGKNDLAKDIAMQVTATDPKYITAEDVPTEETDKEKEIYKENLVKEGKPAEMIEKILEGKIKKYYEEVCLVEQEYIKDDKQKVKNILGDIKVEKIIRYSL